ncbi:MAG: 3-hydroxyisobutyrate dehydrogenase [Rhodospirillaceae bacterium]|jgi:3-hydroxyisobutyrate dehydrogenase-like beta-hydroxyacid dehydrogenase|nr:3-hydroxyisobutyrate dehydrogenase [Rhodospirillaceae bacterium]
MAKTAFIGLGVMGFPMAGHLAAQGHEVTVFNRTAARAEAWTAKHAGRREATPAEAARGAEFVFVCVGNDDDVRSVIYGDDGVLAGMAKGSVLVDHTTASAELAREIGERSADQGIAFLDAPVSGGQAGAENGKLTVMVGGEPATFERAKPIIDSYARACVLMGPQGAGQLAKMVNQICIAGLLQGLSEGMNFAAKAGLDGARLIETISKGAAQSWQMENRAHTMLAGKFDFGFAIDWMRKDLSICLAEAQRNGARLPVTALVDQFYAQVQARGGNRWDTSSLMHLLAND